MNTSSRGSAPLHHYTDAQRRKHTLQRRRRRAAKAILAAILLCGAALGLIFGIPAILNRKRPVAAAASSASGAASAPANSTAAASASGAAAAVSSSTAAASPAPASSAASSTAASAAPAAATDFSWDVSGVEGCDYLLAVNFAGETVTVYQKDANGNYTVPYKAMICSGGEATPLGEFHTIEKYRWRALQGDVYGQYATRITGHILFHSVPYFSQNINDLEYDEFNKLGTDASLGCIRLQVADAKWIYDNCPVGTPTVIYNDAANPGPLGQPTFTQIDPANETLRGWDPTDPDDQNPWKTAQ